MSKTKHNSRSNIMTLENLKQKEEDDDDDIFKMALCKIENLENQIIELKEKEDRDEDYIKVLEEEYLNLQNNFRILQNDIKCIQDFKILKLQKNVEIKQNLVNRQSKIEQLKKKPIEEIRELSNSRIEILKNRYNK